MITAILFAAVLLVGIFFFIKKKKDPIKPEPTPYPVPTSTIDVPQQDIFIEHERTIVPAITSENACILSLSDKVFSSSSEGNVKIGMTLYVNKELSQVFDGHGMWYAILWKDVIDFGGKYAVKVGDDGKVEEWVKC